MRRIGNFDATSRQVGASVSRNDGKRSGAIAANAANTVSGEAWSSAARPPSSIAHSSRATSGRYGNAVAGA